MNKLSCVACQNKMINLGNIPDGILYTCQNCNSKRIFIENYDKSKIQTVYGKAYREKVNHTKVSVLLKVFNENLSSTETQIELLDIGCGNGEFIVALKKLGFVVSGLDCDINALNSIEDKDIKKYWGELGCNFTIENNFNAITLWDVIEHIDDVEKAMSQLQSLMRREGRIFILTPDSESIFDLFASFERMITFNKSQRIMNICLNRYHLNRFSISGLQILLKRFGFRIDQYKKLQLFSLRDDEYTNSFAPGIIKWTNNYSINKIFSEMTMTLIKLFNIKNKIFISAVKI